MTRRRPATTPQIDPVRHGALTAGTAGQLVPRADLDGLAFEQLTLPLLDLPGATVRECRFSDVTAREADWRATTWRETVLERLDVPVVRAARGQWRDVEVRGGRLGSVEAYDAAWQSVRVSEAKLSFVNLRGAELSDVAVTDCVVEELDLTGCTARRVRFAGSRIAQLLVQHSDFEHVDLRGARIEGIQGVDGLRGTILDPGQLSLLAPVLAGQLGITVADEDG